MMSLSQGIITATFPPKERGRALGFNGAMVSIGNLTGPAVGGLLVSRFGWQSIFYINIPIGIVGFSLTLALIPEIHKKSRLHEFDLKGALLFCITVIVMFGSLLLLQENVISSQIFVPVFVLSVILLMLFVYLQRRTKNPFMELSIFHNKVFSLGIVSAFLSFVSIFTTVLFMPFFLYHVIDLPPLYAGLVYAAYPITSVIVAPISGFLSDRISTKPLTVTGMSLCTISLISMSFLNKSSPIFLIGVLLSLLGAGMAMFQSPNTSTVMGSVEKNRLGVAGGLQALARNLGMVTGSSVSLVIFSFLTKTNMNSMSGTSFDAGLFIKGFSAVLIFGGVSSFLALLVSLKRTTN